MEWTNAGLALYKLAEDLRDSAQQEHVARMEQLGMYALGLAVWKIP